MRFPMLGLDMNDLNLLDAESVGCEGFDEVLGGPADDAIATGERDENKLTDLEFNHNHPERLLLRDPKIQPGDKALAKEWMSLRDTVVRPALAKVRAAAPPGSPAALAPPAVPPPPPAGSNAAVAEQVAKNPWARLDTTGKVVVSGCGVVAGGALLLLLRGIIRG